MIYLLKKKINKEFKKMERLANKGKVYSRPIDTGGDEHIISKVG